MARVCQVTGKVPVTGNNVSHSNIKSKRRFLPNLQTKRFFLAEEDKWITLKLSTEGIRTINKNGLYTVVKELRKKGQHIKLANMQMRKCANGFELGSLFSYLLIFKFSN